MSGEGFAFLCTQLAKSKTLKNLILNRITIKLQYYCYFYAP